MSDKTARDALEYALEKEMVYLYVALIAGFVLMSFGFNSMIGLYGPMGPLLKNVAAIITLAGGLLLQFGGTVGILYKVISDATGQE